jgi:hypothetical protein
VWKNSPEYRTVLASLGEIDNNNSQLDEEERNRLENVSPVVPENLPKVTFRSSVASTFREQVVQVTKRIFICYWRFPSYNWYVRINVAKVILTISTGQDSSLR